MQKGRANNRGKACNSVCKGALTAGMVSAEAAEQAQMVK